MKFLALFCVVGLVAATSINSPNSSNKFKWESGTEYKFNYSGRLLTGLPELANHFSGLGIKCEVTLTVGPSSIPEHREFGIRVNEPQYVRVNQALQSDSTGDRTNNNWRNLPLPSYSPVPEEAKRHLESPVVFKLNYSGSFVSITVSENEPEWSINFKKALVTMFQTQFVQEYSTGASSQEAQNRIEGLERDSESGEFLPYWQVKEESLDGICDVTYQLNELPAYMIKEKPDMVPYPEACPGGEDSKYIEVVRTKDVSSCTKRTSFSFYKPGFFRCNTGNCAGMWSRSSITRYVACTSGRTGEDKMTVQSIINEGELQQNLFGFNTEKFLTGNIQKLRLINTSRSGRNNIVYPSSPIELKSLFYEYKLSKLTGQKQAADEIESLINQNELEDQTSAFKALPRHILTTGTFGSQAERENINPERLVPKIKKLFKEIVEEDLFNIVDIAEKQVTFKGLSIARAFSLLPKSLISQIFHELKGQYNSSPERQEMFNNVFFDTLIMGGSVSNIGFAKDMILRDELHNVQLVSIFTFLPHYVVAPTQPLLESLYELVTSSYIRERPLVYNHALLSFTQLLQKACIADNRETSYPTFVFGNFCGPDSNVVINRWIPYLQRELYQSGNNEHRNTVIVALGLLGHRNVISALVPVIEEQRGANSGRPSEEYNRLTRFLAVYSLATVGKKYPEIVVPMVYNVYANPSELTEIRLAAFNVLIRLNPQMSVFHRIAASTWYEKDPEVLQVVNTALFSLASQQDMNNAEDIYANLQRKAWLVYPLIRKTTGAFPTSGALYTSEFLKKLGVGYRGVTSWVGSRESVLPSDAYHSIVYFLDRYEFRPFEVAVRMRGGENLAQQLLELINPELKQLARSEQQQMGGQIKNQIHHEFAHVIEKLKLKANEKRESNGVAEGAVFLNLFEDSFLFYNFQSASSEMLKEKLMPLVKNPSKIRQLAQEGNSLNFQRFINLSPSEFAIPSEMGWPIIVEVHMPTTLSARGRMSAELNDLKLPTIKMDAKFLLASQLTGFVGTICPFTNEFLTTGIDEHIVLNVPADFSIEMNVPDHKLSVRVRPVSSVNRPVDLFHYHVRPYTVRQDYYDLTPMTLSNNVKFIESGEPSKTKSVEWGDYFGLNFRTVVTTEESSIGLSRWIEKMSRYHYNPLNALRFSWMWTALSERGTPSFRKHEVQHKFNPSESATKEVEIQFELGYATKEQEEPIKYHVVKPISAAREEEDNLEQGKPLGAGIPVKVVSKPIGQIQQQQERQQKVKSMLEKLQVKEGSALTLRINTLLRGSRQRSWGYSLNFARGSEGLREKWEVHLESEHEQARKVCVNGHLNVPKIPYWSIDELRRDPLEFNFENVIGYGNNCETKIRVNGNTKSGQQQKKHSKESSEAQTLEKLMQRGQSVPELTQVADKVRRQASILNEVEINVRYENAGPMTQRIPVYVRWALKAFLWPYINRQSQSQSQSQQEQDFYQGGRYSSESSANGQGYSFESGSDSETYRLVFNPRAPVFDLYDISDAESVSFKHVRIPFPFNYLFPISPIRSSLLEISEPLVGKSVYPTCKVTDKWIQTYDNLTTEMPIDDCFHVLSADCSNQKRFGVLIRKTSRSSSESAKELKIYLGKTEILFTPEPSNEREVRVRVNGTEVRELNQKRGHYVPIKDSHGNVICKIMSSIDRVTVLKSELINVLFDGRKVSIEASWNYKNQLCGLCGDLNGQKLAELSGPSRKCVFSKPELMAAAYRVSLPGKQCQPLPGHIEQQLQAETSRCSEFDAIPTKVVKGFKAQTGKCTRHQHEVIERPTEICFSRIPVMECGATCKPQSVVDKRIAFACVPKGRLATLYAMKARQGQILPELENAPESFSTELPLPKSCQQVNRNV